jgi:parallel beta-helix repeat protein
MVISSRTNTLLLVLILAVGVGIAAMLASGVRGGPLDPPGPPSATGTLPQVEPRSPIPPVGWDGSFPIVISQPGSYFLTRNLVGVALAPTWNGIEIAAPRVWLDLNGFSVIADGTGLYGVAVTGSLSGIKVSNGMVAGWGNGGVDLIQASDSVVTGVTTTYNGFNGINLGAGSELSDCVSSHNPGNGVAVFGNGSVVSGCTLVANSQGLVVFGNDDTVIGNTATNNTQAGFSVIPATRVTLAQNIARNNPGFGGNYYLPGCIACDIGPIGTAASSTSPWANISE